MESPFENENLDYLALINDEGQYSLWPENLPVPDGWKNVFAGTLHECEDFIEKEWTDMRPLSLVREMDSGERQEKAATVSAGGDRSE